MPVLELVPVSSDEVFSDTLSTADTDILSHSSQERQKQWPEFFDIPTFSVDVEYRLRQADLLFMSESTYLKVSKELKHDWQRACIATQHTQLLLSSKVLRQH